MSDVSDFSCSNICMYYNVQTNLNVITGIKLFTKFFAISKISLPH